MVENHQQQWQRKKKNSHCDIMKHLPKLKREVSLTLFVLYGLGTIIGAGIYVLVGEVAGRAGIFTPLAFIIAALIALFTGLS